jgi:hypothetical protein
MQSPTECSADSGHPPESDCLGIYNEELYKLLNLKGTDDDDMILDAILIDSSTFSPSDYLCRVHQKTTFEQLKNGLVHLQEVIHQEETLLKDILKSNFDRFVNAKGTIDSKDETMTAYKLLCYTLLSL